MPDNLIDQSKRHIQGTMPLIIDEASVRRLDEERGIWLAVVTTRHHHSRGLEEAMFGILVRAGKPGYFTIDTDLVPRITWLEENPLTLYYQDEAGQEQSLPIIPQRHITCRSVS